MSKSTQGSIELGEFLSLLRYRPKWVGRDLDGVRLVQFRGHGGFSPSLEFGTAVHRGGQYLYFEILDLRGYVEADIIPMDSPTRKRVIHTKLNRKNIEALAEMVNASLGELHRGALP